MGKLIDILAGIAAIGAGIYLLQAHSLGPIDGGESWFEVLAHGIGVYFIARGVWMVSHADRQDAVIARLDRLVELEAYAHDRERPTETAARG